MLTPTSDEINDHAAEPKRRVWNRTVPDTSMLGEDVVTQVNVCINRIEQNEKTQIELDSVFLQCC